MDLSRMSDCMYKDGVYSHDAEMCIDDRCMICNDGHWEGSVHVYPPERPEPPEGGTEK